MMGESNVCFQIETDNSENFPSQAAFHTFRKQRDSFYEIFRIWEEHHIVPGWTFQIALGGKIYAMLTMQNDAINYYHIAKLFKSQLLISCIQNDQQTPVTDNESLNFLKALTHVNPEKLNRLQNRFVTPLPSKNKIVTPSFPGVQEFFKDFILCASNHFFYVHLENCLVHEILELNDTHFVGSEIEDSEATVDEQTRKDFITCLSSLRLLAKVLGLLVALPYRLCTNNSIEVIATQVEVRSRILPSVNLHLCLHNAILQGKLSLTIPWVVKYLAMMDVATLRLPYYKQILEILFYIYKIIKYLDRVSKDSPISPQTAVLLKSTLGWLLELPNFPKDLCPAWQKSYESREFLSLKQLDKDCIQANCVLLVESATADTCLASSKWNLDKLDIINDKALRTCCPTTGRTTSAAAAKMNSNNTNPNKHITPVSSQLKSGGGASTKHLQKQLEEAFFHGQPASTRKTVEFISERVASSCVKHICNTMLSPSREANLKTFRNILRNKETDRLSENKEGSSANDIADIKELVVGDMSSLATKMSKELKDQCEPIIPEICQKRVEKSIESLLAEDSLPPVKEMCIKIATRSAIERIHQWIQSHIVGGSLFTKDMELELNRLQKTKAQLHCIEEKQHNPDAPSPTSVMAELRTLIWEILDNNGESLTATSVMAVLDGLYQTLHERADLLVGPEKLLYSLSADFALFLVAYRTDLFTRKMQDKFIRVWTISNWKVLEPDPSLRRLLSPRNVMLLAQPEKNDVWSTFGKFIRRLLQKNVIDIESFSDQCVALFRQDWPVPILKHLSKCLTEAITNLKSSDDGTEKVKYLLGWIAETYHEIDYCNDYVPID